MDFGVEIRKLMGEGFSEDNAKARLCQDLILQGISLSSLCENITVKGGVAIRNISKDKRRATQDVDIDLIRFPLEDNAIDNLVSEINCIHGVQIKRIGTTVELKHQEYKGKRITVQFIDEYGIEIHCSVDIGVHSDMEIEQIEYCFDISFEENGIILLMNSFEQMIAEKLKSLLKFNISSTRYKDIYDIYYLMDYINNEKMDILLRKYIFKDDAIMENNIGDVIESLSSIFSNSTYLNKLKSSKKNWIKVNDECVFQTIINKLIEIDDGCSRKSR